MTRRFDMTKAIAAVLVLALASMPAACRRRPAEPAGEAPLKVVVSIPPQAYFVERIGGKHVAVDVLVGPGQSPHTFAPTPKQMAGLQQTSIYFRIGVPFEDVLATKIVATNRQLKIVDTRKGIELRQDDGHDHHKGGHDGHEGELDPHIWLSPKLARIQARTICDELCSADEEHAGIYRSNLTALCGDLDELDARIAKALAPVKGRAFYVFHPAFGYFADAYGLRQKAVETGGKSPTARHVKQLIDQAKAEGVTVIFVQPQFSDEAAQAIAGQIGGAVVPMDPLARDYLANMSAMADRIYEALAPAGE